MSRLLFALTCFAFVAGTLHSQNEIFVPANNISFTISTDRRRRASEEITVKYQITNVSNGPIYVPRMPSANPCLIIGPLHINVWLENSEGKNFSQGLLSDCLEGAPPSLRERLGKTAILLQPHESTDGNLMFDPRLLKLPPGDYRVEAILRGWLGSDFTQADLDSLNKLDAPLLRGESHSSTLIMLSP